MWHSGELTAYCVPPDRVAEFKPYAAPHIRRALERAGNWTEDEIWEGLLEQQMLLWIVARDHSIRAAIVTQIRMNRKLGKVCEVIACGGDGLNGWFRFFIHIEQYAKDEGCKVMRVPGRHGWARVLKDYHQPYVVLEKELQ